MAKILFRQKAIDDLNDIWNYTVGRWSEKQADKYYASLKLAFTMIGRDPNIGQTFDEINKGILGFRSGKHIIFYHFTSKDEIEIIRILHERMDFINRLEEK